jgi:hypothetical protein
LLFQFANVLRLEAADQANRRHSAMRIFLDLQIPPGLIEASAATDVATPLPTHFVE